MCMMKLHKKIPTVMDFLKIIFYIIVGIILTLALPFVIVRAIDVLQSDEGLWPTSYDSGVQP